MHLRQICHDHETIEASGSLLQNSVLKGDVGGPRLLSMLLMARGSATVYLRATSGDVTTGGSVYRVCRGGGPARSPTGGSSALGVPDTVDTDRTLSALRLNELGPLGDEPLLFRRKRVWIGDIGCDIDCVMCGRLWLCVCE